MALNIGIKAPDFCGVIQDGTKINLRDFKGKWVVLYFYPKDNTSGCTQEACDFRDNMQRITSLGAEVIGVSSDSAKSHQGFIEKQNLNFNLIADTEKEIVQLYEVWGEKKMYGRSYFGVIRTTYIISPDMEISEVYTNVKVKGHVDEVITRLTDLIK